MDTRALSFERYHIRMVSKLIAVINMLLLDLDLNKDRIKPSGQLGVHPDTYRIALETLKQVQGESNVNKQA